MKRFFVFLLLLFTVVSLSACDKAVGEWKVYEIEVLGTTFQVGEKVLGQEVTEDMLVLKINNDNTGEKITKSGSKTTIETFTWSKEGDVYYLTLDNQTLEVKLVDKHLEVELLGTIYRLSK